MSPDHRLQLFVYWMVQLPLAWALAVPAGFGVQGVFVTIAVCQTLLAATGVLVFRRGGWKTRAI